MEVEVKKRQHVEKKRRDSLEVGCVGAGNAGGGRKTSEQ